MKNFVEFSRHVLFVALGFMLITSFSSSAYSQALNNTLAKQAILLDYETGTVLFEKNAQERMPTSSMSKVMTMYLVFEALEDGRLLLDSKLPVSEKAWRKGGSKMFVEVGKRVAVEDLVRGVIIQSGNDATIVLAEGLAGSEEDFAKALTAKAKEIGMHNSNFMNASGWPDPDHYSTAYDLAVLARNLIQNFPEHYHYYSEKTFTFNNIKQRNRNPLLYRNIGADGVKTGHTEAGGYGLIASGERDGRRVILVVNGLETEKDRAQEGARLLEWGMRGFSNYTLFESGDTVEDASVFLGKSNKVGLKTKDTIKISMANSLKNDLNVTVNYDGPLQAPINEGDEVGTLRVEIPRGQTLEYPVYAAENVEKLGLFKRIFVNIKTKLDQTKPEKGNG